MLGNLYKINDEYKYYLIDNVGAYNCIAVEFGTFKSSFISIDMIQTQMENLEFNIDNLKNLLDNYAAFKDFIDYEYFNTHNYIIFHTKYYYIKSWLDIFNFANKII